MCGLQMLGVCQGSQLRSIAARTPPLDRVAPASLRHAPHHRRHVVHVVCVQVREEHLRGGCDRQTQTCEIGKGTGTEVEEEEVLLLVADLDQQRGRCLPRPDDGSPLPRIVTRISPGFTGSASCRTTPASPAGALPTIGVVVRGTVLHSQASCVLAVIPSSDIGAPDANSAYLNPSWAGTSPR
jgi:hypothetical protein